MSTVSIPRSRTNRALPTSNPVTPSPAARAREEARSLPESAPAHGTVTDRYSALPECAEVTIRVGQVLATYRLPLRRHRTTGNGLPAYSLCSEKLPVGGERLQIGIHLTVCRPRS